MHTHNRCHGGRSTFLGVALANWPTLFGGGGGGAGGGGRIGGGDGDRDNGDGGGDYYLSGESGRMIRGQANV